MIVLKPIPHETIWGGSRLLPYGSGQEKRIGHLYALFDDAGGANEILNGPYAGESFHRYFTETKKNWHLEMYEFFPLVLALVEAREHLSIQVHPDDETAARLEGAPWGKNESWYFIEAPEEGSIFCGSRLKESDLIAERIREGRGGEIADRLIVKQGDYVYVRAGTLHAMTAGSFVYEIEENSEYTYRLYDYNRRDNLGVTRELHVDKGMRALKPKLKSVTARYEDAPDHVITERMYTTRLLQAEEIAGYINQSETLECLTVIDPETEVTLDGCTVRMGNCIDLEPQEKLTECIGITMMARTIPWKSN